MVHTTELDITSSDINSIDRCQDGIDINNSCRHLYLQRMESIEQYKRSTKKADTGRTTIDAALEKLRSDMIGLLDQDAVLMRQMLILNEKVEELKANNICQMRKESMDSEDSLYEIEGITDKYILESQDSLYHTDEQSDESLIDSKESLYSGKVLPGEKYSNSVDSLYHSDEFSSDDENIDIGKTTIHAIKMDSLIPESNASISSAKLVDDVTSYDSMFEKLLDFEDKI